MKANQADLSKLLIASGDTVCKYEQKLALARSLILNTTEKCFFEKPENTFLERHFFFDQKGGHSSNPFCKILITICKAMVIVKK